MLQSQQLQRFEVDQWGGPLLVLYGPLWSSMVQQKQNCILRLGAIKGLDWELEQTDKL